MDPLPMPPGSEQGLELGQLILLLCLGPSSGSVDPSCPSRVWLAAVAQAQLCRSPVCSVSLFHTPHSSLPLPGLWLLPISFPFPDSERLLWSGLPAPQGLIFACFPQRQCIVSSLVSQDWFGLFGD